MRKTPTHDRYQHHRPARAVSFPRCRGHHRPCARALCRADGVPARPVRRVFGGGGCGACAGVLSHGAAGDRGGPPWPGYARLWLCQLSGHLRDDGHPPRSVPQLSDQPICRVDRESRCGAGGFAVGNADSAALCRARKPRARRCDGYGRAVPGARSFRPARPDGYRRRHRQWRSGYDGAGAAAHGAVHRPARRLRSSAPARSRKAPPRADSRRCPPITSSGPMDAGSR